MNQLNYFTLLFALVTVFISCQSEETTQDNDDFTDGTYYFRETNKQDDFLKEEFILNISGNQVTGKSYSFFEEGDHEIIALDAYTMMELDVKGVVEGNTLKLEEMEANYGADFSEGYVLKFQNIGTWTFENNQFKGEMTKKVMEKVKMEDLNSPVYKALSNAKVVH